MPCLILSLFIAYPALTFKFYQRETVVKNHQIIAASAIAIAMTFGHSSVRAEADDAGVKSFNAVVAPSAANQAEPAAAISAPAAESAAKSGKRTASRRTAGKFAVVDGSPSLRAIVARHAAAQGVPFALADAVVRVESRYNPRASNKGNYGLMQIRHQTARGLGYGGSAAGLLDAETNARYGMMYLAQAYRMSGGDTCRTVMKYQSGHMATQMSSANRAYCAKVRTYVASL